MKYYAYIINYYVLFQLFLGAPPCFSGTAAGLLRGSVSAPRPAPYGRCPPYPWRILKKVLRFEYQVLRLLDCKKKLRWKLVKAVQ